MDGEGNVYIADSGNRRIRRVDLAGTISSFAGTGEPGFSGDGGPASAARLDFPTGVAVDGEGNVYIADSGNRRIRRVDLAGTISSFAGTGEPGFSGDGGPASAARLGNPWNVAVDGEGNVYIADSGNRRIRRVDLAGTISSFAGTGEPGFSGDGGPASAARLGNPWNVAVDGEGNVYIADSGNRRIRRVDLAGTISSFAGIGEPGFSGDGGPASAARLGYPEGIAVDGAGNVYIADSSNRRIRRVDLAGTISSFAGTGEPGFSGDGGPASAARLNFPTGIAVDGAGNVYIADRPDHRVRKLMLEVGSEFRNPTGPATTQRFFISQDSIQVTGQVTGKVYCEEGTELGVLRLSVRLNYRNVSNEVIIMPKPGLVVRETVYADEESIVTGIPELDQRSTIYYQHGISGIALDGMPASSFILLEPSESFETERDSVVGFEPRGATRELGGVPTGSHFLLIQTVGFSGSDEEEQRLAEMWSGLGRFVGDSLVSSPIPFVVLSDPPYSIDPSDCP